jgi:hypothetical protein
LLLHIIIKNIEIKPPSNDYEETQISSMKNIKK